MRSLYFELERRLRGVVYRALPLIDHTVEFRYKYFDPIAGIDISRKLAVRLYADETEQNGPVFDPVYFMNEVRKQVNEATQYVGVSYDCGKMHVSFNDSGQPELVEIAIVLLDRHFAERRARSLR
jgi:hypothetical protein